MDLATVAELDRRFGIQGIAQVLEGNGGLAKVVVNTQEAAGEIYLHGAHITSWQPPGAEEVLFLSAKSRWEDGRAIRGGVPISFPWFARKVDDPKAPAHGFVRTIAWSLESISHAANSVTVTMSTESNDNTKKWWPADFHLVHRATFGSELAMELEVTGTGANPLRFEEALHAYFRVGRIDQARVNGLSGFQYVDKTDSDRKKTQQGPIAIVSATDRVYLNTNDAIELEDGELRRRLRIAKENSSTTVVWNPWLENAKALPDLGDGQWLNMICIEASNVSDSAVVLMPGQEHRMKATIRVVDF